LKKNNKIDLVILAGGKGTRIQTFLKGNPKPLVKFKNISFLQILLNNYCKYPFENIYILCGYKGTKIYKKFNNKLVNFVKVKCIIERKPLGTAGALNGLKKIIKNDFFLVNGDSYCEVELSKFFFQYNDDNKIFLTNNNSYKSNSKLANLSLDNQNKVFFSKNGKLMNAGIYFFKKKFLNKIKKKSFSLENEIITDYINKKKIKGLIVKGFFIDIGTEKNLFKAMKKLPSILKKPAAFLDRDGVINYDYDYVFEIKNFKFMKDTIKTLKYLIENRYYIFVITNQAGIAKKKFSLRSFVKLQKYLKYYLNRKYIHFDDVQYCPYHKNALIKKYKKSSTLRKPNNGMINKLNRNWFIDKKKSFFIGDQFLDMLCAKKSNLYYQFREENFLTQIKKIVGR